MSNNVLGGLLVAAGVLGVLAGLLVDALGFGQHPGFGWKQWLSMAVGAVLAVVGLVVLRQPDRTAGTPPTRDTGGR